MVTRRWTATLMQVAYNLGYILECCRRTVRLPAQLVPVKGDNFVLPMLRQGHQIILYVASGTPSLAPISQEIGVWVDALDRKYGERVIWSGPPYHLDAVDQGSLASD